MHELTIIQKIAIWALPVLFAITLHEVAHGWVARKLGDPTAMMLGRLTVNPVKHIDPIGTVLVPALMLIMGGFLFGWAKPVPINPDAFEHPRRGMAVVAIAGPLSNLVMAVVWALVIRLGFVLNIQDISLALIYMGQAGVVINIILMLVNLLPLPPLDGGRVLSGLVSGPMSAKLDRIEPFGFIIIVVLLMTGMLGVILGPPFRVISDGLFQLGGLHVGGL